MLNQTTLSPGGFDYEVFGSAVQAITRRSVFLISINRLDSITDGSNWQNRLFASVRPAGLTKTGKGWSTLKNLARRLTRSSILLNFSILSKSTAASTGLLLLQRPSRGSSALVEIKSSPSPPN